MTIDRRKKLAGTLTDDHYSVLDEMKAPKWLKSPTAKYKFRKLVQFIRGIDEVVLVIRPQDADILALYAFELDLLESYSEELLKCDPTEAGRLRREISKCVTTILDIQTKLLFTPSARSKLNIAAEKDDVAVSGLLEKCGIIQ